MLSKYRPAADIFAFSQSETVRNRMNALWGTRPLMCPAGLSVERMAQFAEEELKSINVLSPEDVFGLVAGTRNSPGATNFMRLIQVKGSGASTPLQES